jgi:hypothetical protein
LERINLKTVDKWTSSNQDAHKKIYKEKKKTAAKADKGKE